MNSLRNLSWPIGPYFKSLIACPNPFKCLSRDLIGHLGFSMMELFLVFEILLLKINNFTIHNIMAFLLATDEF
jgi:hypothetical protein